MRTARVIPFAFALLLMVPSASAQYTAADTLQAVVPGLVYKEFSRTMESDEEWRVTDPDASYNSGSGSTPQDYLPNPVLELDVDDLQGAIRAVAVIDVWGGHVGTSGKQFRFNDNGWIDIPDVQGTPTAPECYMHQATMEVEVPIEDLVEGLNVFEGTADRQTCFTFNWGQWGWYGLMLRIYYDPAERSAPVASITSPVDGANLPATPTVEVDAASAAGIDRVDVIGRYRAYDVDGDGVFQEWQRSYHLLPGDTAMTLRDHVGSATASPYAIDWDTTWIPDQDEGSIELVARVRDADGLWTVTDRVTGLSLRRPGVSVQLYEPENVEERYWVRNRWTKSSDFTVPAGADLTAAVSAQLFTRTWNGINGNALPGEVWWTRLNGWTLPEYGEDHAYALDGIDVPIAELRDGSNTVTYFSESSNHGAEVLWPGPAVVVRYDDPTPSPAYVVASPSDRMAVEGATVSFAVEAIGPDPITYQWQRDGVDLPGETGPTLVLPAVAAGDDGALFRCAVTNANGSDTSSAAELTVVLPGPRVTDGRVVLYTFEEAGGDTIFDRAGQGAPVDLVIGDASQVTWSADGLTVDGAASIASPGAASGLVAPLKATNELTLEAWLQPANLTQNGPARIVSLSSGPLARNLTLGQGVFGDSGERYGVRLRTTGTDDNGLPSLDTPTGTLTTDLTHVVFTRDTNGVTRIFVDGVEVARGDAIGDLSNWDDAFRLALGDEVGGGRPWLGTMRYVAFHDRALSPLQILQNLAAGPSTETITTSAPTPTRFALGPNVPNPFNPATTISFEIPTRADVRLTVFDLRGRRVTSLVERTLDAGVHRVQWDGRNARGDAVSSGVYFYRLQAVGADGIAFGQSRRMVLLK